MTAAPGVARIGTGEPAEKNGPAWHTVTPEDALQRMGSGPEGLHPDDAARRLAAEGPNELPREKEGSVIILFLRQFASVLILTLFAAAGISAFMGEWVEAIAILVIVVLAGIVGFIQEYQAERALEALQRLAAPNATVRRDGTDRIIPAREIVRGDVIVLKTGDAIPADARIIDAPHLEVDESTLTGESQATRKIILPLAVPSLGALAILLFTWIWNDYFWALSMSHSIQAQTIMIGIAAFRGRLVYNWNSEAASSLLSMLPPLIMFFAFQKFFIQGIRMGGIK